MADPSEIQVPVETAQAKKGNPKLPSRPRSGSEVEPTPARETIKSLSERLLGVEQTIANLGKEFQALLSTGGQDRKRADQIMKEIVHAGAILPGVIYRHALTEGRSIDPEFDDAQTPLLKAAESVYGLWVAYDGGTAYPDHTWDPRRWLSARAHRLKIDAMRTSLGEFKRQFERMKPALLNWAERPSPNTPPKERIPDDGLPKLA